MKCISLGLIAATCVIHASVASASTGGEAQAGVAKPQVAVAPPRPGMFAAASAPFATRLTPEQRDEWRFLKDAAAAGRFERDAARMALAKSGDANVRTLAATLVNHHAGSLQSLQQMLHARNIAPPMLANCPRKQLNRLSKIQGATFEREWVEFVAL